MRELSKKEMIDIFTKGMVNSFIEGNGELSSEEAYLISDTMTVLSVILYASGDKEKFEQLKETYGEI